VYVRVTDGNITLQIPSQLVAGPAVTVTLNRRPGYHTFVIGEASTPEAPRRARARAGMRLHECGAVSNARPYRDHTSKRAENAGNSSAENDAFRSGTRAADTKRKLTV